MTDRLHDILAAHASSYSISECLHEVPPYEVHEVAVDGVRAVCKVDAHPEGEAAIEGRVHRYVDRETAVPVPEILAVGSDHYVMAYDGAVPDPEADISVREWARPAGAGMAQLHAETARDRTGRPTVSDGRLTSETHDSWVETALAFLRGRRAYLETVGHADIADRVIEFVEANPAVFETDGQPVLCHGNWLPDHVGVERARVEVARVQAVIDFEHALFAPPAYDYWRVVLPLFGDDKTARERFEAGYESVRPLPTDRREAHLLLNGVSYLRSLYLQDQHDPDTTERKAAQFREGVSETLETVRQSGV